MRELRYVFYGMVMGMANVVPGVSGGTMAVILNFYDRLISVLSLHPKALKKNARFLLFLIIGALIGIIGLSNVMEFCLEYYHQETYFGFIGVIFGSVPLLYSHIKSVEKGKKQDWFFFAATFVLMIVLMFVNGDKTKGVIHFTQLNPISFAALFAAMAVAAFTMIIPGISGSLLLIIMGMYRNIYGYAIPNLIIPLCIPILLGAIFGIVAGSRLVSYLMENHKRPTYLAILGLMIGSVFQIFPGFSLDAHGFFSIISFAVMFAVVYWFSKKQMNEKEG